MPKFCREAVLTAGLAVCEDVRSEVLLDKTLKELVGEYMPQEEIWTIECDPRYENERIGWYEKENRRYIKLLRQMDRMARLAPTFSPHIHSIPVRIRPHIKVQTRNPDSLLGVTYCPGYDLDHVDVLSWIRRKMFLVLFLERARRHGSEYALQRVREFRNTSRNRPDSCRCVWDTSDI